MIFYGTKGSLIDSKRTTAIECDTCKQISPHTVSVYGKYGYLYWIPVFPMSKKVFSECNNCKATNEFSGMNEKLRRASIDIKKETKTPIWYWSGLGIIAILIAIGYYYSAQHDKDVVNYIKEPLAGDVIRFKNKNTNYYSTLKISSVTKDSIFVIQNNYETDKKSGISDIDKSKNYTTEPFGLGRNEIQEMFDKNIFYDINR